MMESILRSELERIGVLKQFFVCKNRKNIYRGFGLCEFETQGAISDDEIKGKVMMEQGPYCIIFKNSGSEVEEAIRTI